MLLLRSLPPQAKREKQSSKTKSEIVSNPMGHETPNPQQFNPMNAADQTPHMQAEQKRGTTLAGDDAVITREAAIVPGSFNEADNTVNVVFSTGARGLRYDWRSDSVYEEELDISPAAIDMARIDAGVCQVLNSHNSWDLSNVMGNTVRGWVEGGQAMATLALSVRDEMRGYVADIKAGIIRAISVGYRVETWQRIMPEERADGGKRILMRALRWAPHEISFVPVPFDMGASSRSAGGAQPLADLPALDAPTAAYLAGSAVAGAQRGGAQPQQQAAQQRQQGSLAVSEAILSAQQRSAAGATPVSPAPAAPAAPSQEQTTMTDQVRTEGGAPATPDTTAATTQAAHAAQAAEATKRSADIVELCTRHALPQLAAEFIRSGKTVADVGIALLDELARKDAAAGGHQNTTRVTTVRDEVETRMQGMQEALLSRVDSSFKPTDNGRRFRSLTLLELGRDMLAADGVDTRGMDKLTVAGMMLRHRSNAGQAFITRSGGMHTTSDFGYLLANVATKRLRNQYEENAGTYAMWARRAPNAPDFKAMNVVQLSGMPDLLKTNEAGEFTYGTLTDAGETYGLATYGRIVTLSRQAVVNDDVRAFDRIITGFGASAARLENRLVYAQLTANAVMGDGTVLFHASHNNLSTGAGSVLSLDAMRVARAAMRKQKGLAGEELNLAPAYLIVPAELEQSAYQFTSSNYVPATAANVNEFRQGGRTAVEPIVEPILDADSATRWYMAARSGQVDTVEYCWLDGAEGPVIETETGFESDGISIKCREDFAAKVVDHRGLHRANGA